MALTIPRYLPDRRASQQPGDEEPPGPVHLVNYLEGGNFCADPWGPRTNDYREASCPFCRRAFNYRSCGLPVRPRHLLSRVAS